MNKITRFTGLLAAACMLTLGFAPHATAGVVTTTEAVSADAKAERITRVRQALAQAEVAEQLEHYGVAPEQVAERVDSLTDQELLQLEQHIDRHVAGADAVGIIGAVFLVLLILELVGVTDIFKSI